MNPGLALRLFAIFTGSAIAGTLGDANHVRTKTDGYPEWHLLIPGLNVPVWVPLLFGSAGLLLALSTVWLDRKLRFRPRRPLHSTRTLLCSMGFFLIYLASGSLPLPTPGPMDAFLFLAAFTLWWTFDATRVGLLYGVLAIGGGCLVEITLVQTGVFYYFGEFQALWGIPSWLPSLYLAASVAGGALGRQFLTVENQ